MSLPTLTIESHTETATGFALTVRVADTDPACLSGIAGSAIAHGPDALHTSEWGPDVDPEDQRHEARLLLEHALDEAAAQPAEPVQITPAGTEL